MASPPKLHWSTYLWPGLPHVRTRGSWAGLALAVGFTSLANALVVAAVVWPRWLPPRVLAGGGVLLAVVWVLAWIDARAEWRRRLAEWASGETGDPVERSDRLFREAQASYLAGDFVAAEQTLARLLKLDRRDAEARLLLATLHRRNGRHDQALKQLDQLDRLETAAAWAVEIAAERRQLNNTTVPADAGASEELSSYAPPGDAPTLRRLDDSKIGDAAVAQTDDNERDDTTSRARDERPATIIDPPAGNQAA